MLSAAAFSDFDAPRLASLRTQVQNMAVRQDRYRREALSLGVSPDNPETYRLIQCAERDAEALVEVERLIALALRFAADEASGRPEMAHASAAPRSTGRGAAPGRAGLLARAAAALTGSPASNGVVS